MRADRESTQEKTYQARQSQSTDDDRSEQDHREENEELEYRPGRSLDRRDRHHELLRMSGMFAWLPSHLEESRGIVPFAVSARIDESTIVRFGDPFGSTAARVSPPLNCPSTWNRPGSARARPSATGRSSMMASAP